MKAYVPQTQETFVFNVSESQIRSFLEDSLGVTGLSVNDVLDVRNLVYLSDRLMCRVVHGRPIIIFTRRARSWANSSSALVGTLSTASRNRSRSAVLLSATGLADVLAIVSPSCATKGVAAMDMATVVNRTLFWPVEIKPSFFARPVSNDGVARLSLFVHETRRPSDGHVDGVDAT